MKPKFLMICLLRSSAAALATHPRGGSGSVGVGVTGGRSTMGCIAFSRNRSAASTLDDDSSCSGSETSTSLNQNSRNFQNAPTSPDSRDSSPLLASGHIAFRLARRTDVPQIQSCNLATLPENYNANFYVNHMRSWPELTLVAEHIPEGVELGELDRDGSTITPLREYICGMNRSSKGRANKKPRKEIVGYILGKVEERPINPRRQLFSPSRIPLYEDEETLSSYMNGNSNHARSTSRGQRQSSPKEKIGHVTSLAVHSHARRLGIASSLLHQLHFHLQECHGASSAGLHVRISNRAAVRLYCEEGYDVADIIPLYYGDGEDAYFMRKDFDNNVAPTSGALLLRSMSRPQEKEQVQQQQWKKQQQHLRRGEKQRNDWLYRDATRGSFFENRKSRREMHSEEYWLWVNKSSSGNNHPSVNSMASSCPSLSGQFKQSFRTFFNSGDQMPQRQMNQFQLPPWEIGPVGLRLPRYCKVIRKEDQSSIIVEAKGISLNDLVTRRRQDKNSGEDIESYEEAPLALDACVASGSV